MRKLLAACCFVLSAFIAAPVFAQNLNPVTPLVNGAAVSAGNPLPVTGGGGSSTPYAFTPLSPMQAGLTIASATTLTIPATSTYAVVCAAGNNVNYTTDGTTTPTASVGMTLLQNSCVSLQGATVLSNFKAIQQAATATLNISYFK